MSYIVFTRHREKLYYNNIGQYHREDGPAIYFSDGSVQYYINNKLHRLDGPAQSSFFIDQFGNWTDIELSYFEEIKHYGTKCKRWYYNGKEVKCSSQEEFEKMLKLKVFW